ncbi:Pre-rRNA-processing protein TSR2-domain-containing protein [Truncatella angustata]|uniref:Pre-rRNA-processing protein TSR2-domain-containing protein n=1 Tax=Truncatella angustata TaxID=152316 RepID=A0A9P8RKB2_9PEZI|nr:Pre-rRNA-processing protein TSR2-domain-containing protein [Truncatella angustata]KAH6647636.1 Pre-rRNA-processing protein TSR2-domain-containing protein [Truncatella angustata]
MSAGLDLNISTPEKKQEAFEQAVALTLHLWPALTLAVQNNWSDNSGEDVRDWFAGAIVELFPTFPDLAKFSAKLAQNQGLKRPENLEEPYQEDVETRCLQIMADEFNIDVDDDSGYEISEQIMQLRAQCTKGQFDDVEKLREKWSAGKGKKVVMKQAPDQDQDTDWEDEDDDSEDGDGDVEMGDAPGPAPKEKPQPEVDDDGFTKVTRKR